jgi:hypothetical protein
MLTVPSYSVTRLRAIVFQSEPLLTLRLTLESLLETIRVWSELSRVKPV